ncbi:MAG: hypothetical protein ACLQVD_03690 [Capsulimonadaceae bacterium]
MFRIPSLRKRIAARVSIKRVIRHRLGLKAPRGLGWITNPRRALYNRIYRRTSVGCVPTLLLVAFVACSTAVLIIDQTNASNSENHRLNTCKPVL